MQQNLFNHSLIGFLDFPKTFILIWLYNSISVASASPRHDGHVRRFFLLGSQKLHRRCALFLHVRTPWCIDCLVRSVAHLNTCMLLAFPFMRCSLGRVTADWRPRGHRPLPPDVTCLRGFISRIRGARIEGCAVANNFCLSSRSSQSLHHVCRWETGLARGWSCSLMMAKVAFSASFSALRFHDNRLQGGARAIVQATNIRFNTWGSQSAGN